MPPQNYKQNPDPKFDEEVKHRRVDKFPNKKPVIVESQHIMKCAQTLMRAPTNVGKHNKQKKDLGHNTAYQCRISNTSSSKSS